MNDGIKFSQNIVNFIFSPRSACIHAKPSHTMSHSFGNNEMVIMRVERKKEGRLSFRNRRRNDDDKGQRVESEKD